MTHTFSAESRETGAAAAGGSWRFLALLVAAILFGAGSTLAAEPLTMLVMDPLASRLACECVNGHAQRDYEKFGKFLEKQLGRPVIVLFAESLVRARQGNGRIDLVIGKQSVVKSDAAELHWSLRPLAMLTGKDGATTLTGLFIVRNDDPAKTIADLKGYKVFFGPADSDEKHAAAIAALRAAGVAAPEKPETRPGCSDAALDVLQEQGPAAGVISSYAMPLLEGCGAIQKGSLKIVGETGPVPFIAVFAAESVDEAAGKQVLAALFAANKDSALLKIMESKKGFVEMPNAAESGWPGWRGANRDAMVNRLPERLPEKPKFLWTKTLTSEALAGVAATNEALVVADRDATDQNDVFRCLNPMTGAENWQLEYAAPGKLDYGNSARATPLIHDGKVYLLGAFGHLHCVQLIDGSVLWKKNIVRDYGAKLITWGMAASPLVVDGKLIVNPGAKDAALVALDPATGKELWRCGGAAAAYASFIVGRFGGVRQIVGYDAASLGGWNVENGRRLWTLVPPERGDFNVPTPIDCDGKLLVSTENNGTRLYDFDEHGVIRPKPLAEHADLAPDASTPVAIGGRVFGCRGELFCLDAKSGLKQLWSGADKAFDDYVSIIGSPERLLITTNRGELLLVGAGPTRYELISRLQVFDDGSATISHPALVGKRLYLRGGTTIGCVLLE